MTSSKLKPIILKKLLEKTKLEESSIRSALSRIRSKYEFLTLNASAQLFAKERHFSVTRHLDPVDRQALANLKMEKIKVPIKRRNRKTETIIQFAIYETDDPLLEKHIEEINRTYTYKCYTATFILCRKVLENLLVDHILKKKYASNAIEHREKYFDINNGRNLDFGKLLENLRKSATEFSDKKLVMRICQLLEGFKETANEMTHSLYYIAKKRELDEKDFQGILDLIKRLEKDMERQKA